MLAYKALTAVNIALMCLLAWRTGHPFFRAYLLCMACAAVLQNTRWWNLTGEVVLACFGALWALSELPKGRRAVTEALALGTLVAAVLLFAVPLPWPNYSHAMYFLRLYTAAFFCGISVPCAFTNLRCAISVAWWMAVLLAGSLRFSYTFKAITANAAWTCCLAAWLMASRTANRVPTSIPPE